MRNIDIIKPVFYITDDNNKIISEIEKKLDFMLMCINSSLEKTTQKTTQKIKLNNNQLKIIELIGENPKITRNELADILNITSDGVKYNLKKLVDNNIIERIGPDNGGYWKVK